MVFVVASHYQSFFTAWWYVVTKAIVSLQCFCSRPLTGNFLYNFYFFGYLCASRRRLKFAMHSSCCFEEFVQSDCFAFDQLKITLEGGTK